MERMEGRTGTRGRHGEQGEVAGGLGREGGEVGVWRAGGGVSFRRGFSDIQLRQHK